MEKNVGAKDKEKWQALVESLGRFVWGGRKMFSIIDLQHVASERRAREKTARET